MLAIRLDKELDLLFKKSVIPGAGTIPSITGVVPGRKSPAAAVPVARAPAAAKAVAKKPVLAKV